MNPPANDCTRARARSTAWARAAAARSLFAWLAACGGRSHDPHSQCVVGAGGESNATGGAGSNGVGGASAAARTANVGAGQTRCWLWNALKNQPNPGASGIDTCRSFYDLELVVRENCVYKVIDPSPVPPDARITGDCCYSITGYSCR